MNNENLPMEQEQEEKFEILQVSNVEAVGAMTRAEIDAQVATAKAYPRNLANVLNNIETLATLDEETAGECFYMLRRQGKLIEGPSARMAEIIASAWGNIRVQARIVGNDGKMITAQGICHDLESNYAVSAEVKRRITDKNGRTFSEDMQVVTGNAACSIAMRNALFKVVPKAIVKNILAKTKQVSLGKATSLEESRKKMIDYFQKIGADQQKLFEYLDVTKIEEINVDMVVELRGLATAIKEGTTTVQETFFPKPAAEVTQEEVKPSGDLFGGEKKEETNKKNS